MAYATLSDALQYAEIGVGSIPNIKAEALLEDASDWVSSLASAPASLDPVVLADYASRARRAEMRVFSYLAETGNLKSESVAGISLSYIDPDRVAALVGASMGAFAGGSSPDVFSVAVLSTFPPRPE